MFFKRLFTIWFLLFTLISGAAWAMDDHAEEGHGAAVFDAATGHDEPLPWSPDDCSDHCCHAAAHVVALIGRTCASMETGPSSVDLMLSDTYPDSLPLAPPYHPPIV